MRFGEPLPHSTRIDVIEDGGQVVEEVRIVRVSGLAGCRTCHQPPWSWLIADDSNPSFVVFRRKPPWLRGHCRRAGGTLPTL
jgi:hypothetical protein